jgi:hypothetical protein
VIVVPVEVSDSAGGDGEDSITVIREVIVRGNDDDRDCRLVLRLLPLRGTQKLLLFCKINISYFVFSDK